MAVAAVAAVVAAAAVAAEAAVAAGAAVAAEAAVAAAGCFVADFELDPFCGRVCFVQTLKAPCSNKNDCFKKEQLFLIKVLKRTKNVCICV